jgi:hypothetical protein
VSEREKQLLEFWKSDAVIWKRRTEQMYHALDNEPSKIDLAKRRANSARVVRQKIARLATVEGRRRTRKVHGTMTLSEKPDRICSPSVSCVVCGRNFPSMARGNRPAALYCSKNCAHTAWRARRALANG